jgi:Uma2 family endonuclease
MAAPGLMTTQEYLRTPETRRPQELIFGRFRVSDAPLPRHQQIVAELHIPLALHVRKLRLGSVWLAPLDVILDYEAGLIVQPDLCFVDRNRMPFVPDRMRLVPDLMIDVLSPKPRIGEVDERLGWYAVYGVLECWLVHQHQARTEVIQFEKERIAARRSFGWEVPLRSTVLPDFRPVIYDVLEHSVREREN